jgi:hypothetical protein
MKEHQDESVRWIYKPMQRHPKGVADFSDAGMVYFLLTGDENGSPAKFRKLVGDGVLAPKNKAIYRLYGFCEKYR